MKVKFWGVRGSLPSPFTSADLEDRLAEVLRRAEGERFDGDAEACRFVQALPAPLRTTAGGNTPCVEVRTAAGDLIILDAGSGIRALGSHLMREGFAEGKGQAWLLFSHTHWDHIHGFPFFAPAYVKGNALRLGGCHDGLESRLRDQHDPRFFPVPFDALSAAITFKQMGGTNWLCNRRVKVSTVKLSHPGDSYAYRLEAEGATIVYATDGEYKRLDAACMAKYVEFFRGADLLIFDAMFTVMESIEKADWGHSSAVVGVELATAANVCTLVLFHHDPESSDSKVAELVRRAREYQNIIPAQHRSEVVVAREGLEIEL